MANTSFYLSFRAETKTDEELHIGVYDYVGKTWDGTGTTARDVRDMLANFKGKTIKLRINSRGGDAFEGVAIYNLLRDASARGCYVTCDVDGLAASAASLIACAADAVRVPQNACIMIHSPWTYVGGNSEDLKREAEMLERLERTLAETYVEACARRGVTKTVDEVIELLRAETWLFGEEAVALGLADTVTEPLAAAASLDVSAFRNAPATLQASAEAEYPREVTAVLTELRAAKEEIRELRLASDKRERERVIASLISEKRTTPGIAEWLESQPLDVVSRYAADAPVLAIAATFEAPQVTNVGEIRWRGKLFSEMSYLDKHNLHAEDPQLFEAMKASFSK